jgi:hypothetical protein
MIDRWTIMTMTATTTSQLKLAAAVTRAVEVVLRTPLLPLKYKCHTLALHFGGNTKSGLHSKQSYFVH